jgi:hypothetical protein
VLLVVGSRLLPGLVLVPVLMPGTSDDTAAEGAAYRTVCACRTTPEGATIALCRRRADDVRT